jgi:hypothetical protein
LEACVNRSGSALLNCCIRWTARSAARGRYLEGLDTAVAKQDRGGQESLLGALSGKEENTTSVLAEEIKDSH